VVAQGVHTDGAGVSESFQNAAHYIGVTRLPGISPSVLFGVGFRVLIPSFGQFMSPYLGFKDQVRNGSLP
jgi:hypothetical protein